MVLQSGLFREFSKISMSVLVVGVRAMFLGKEAFISLAVCSSERILRKSAGKQQSDLATETPTCRPLCQCSKVSSST
jgi:hypothetical protein